MCLLTNWYSEAYGTFHNCWWVAPRIPAQRREETVRGDGKLRVGVFGGRDEIAGLRSEGHGIVGMRTNA